MLVGLGIEAVQRSLCYMCVVKENLGSSVRLGWEVSSYLKMTKEAQRETSTTTSRSGQR